MTHLHKLFSTYKHFFLYGIIGSVCASLDFIIFWGLTKYVAVPYLTANVISVSAGIFLSFYLNRTYNFKVSDHPLTRLILFFGVGLSGLFVSSLLLHFLISVTPILPLFAKAISIIVVVFFQFLINKFVTFKEEVNLLFLTQELKTNSPHSIGSYFLIITIFILYAFPYFFLGQDAHFEVHDNLDSDVVWFKTLADSGHWFSFSNEVVVENFMNGIPRNSLPSAFNLISLLFVVLPPFYALVINKLLTHVMAFIGMKLLLNKFVFPQSQNAFLTTLLAVSFALIPFYGTHPGIAISGLPLIFWALLSVSQSVSSKIHWVVIILFPFYSSLIYTGVFFIFLYGIYLLLDTIVTKKWNIKGFIALALCFFTYLISEINLIIQTLGKSFLSHRLEMTPIHVPTQKAIALMEKFLEEGQYHAPSFHYPTMLYIIIIGFFSILLFRRKQLTHISIETTFMLLCVVVGVIIIFQGVWFWDQFYFFKQEYSIFRVIQWNRFYWLLPFLWAVLFALSIQLITKRSPYYITYFIMYLVIGYQIKSEISGNKELITNYQKIQSKWMGDTSMDPSSSINTIHKVSYRAFYAEALFNEIKEYIATPINRFRVISIGLFPEIATYNGFYSLDSYQRNYPLTYKHQFREIIEKELDKNEIVQNYFDHWGSRCYAFSAELGKHTWYGKNAQTVIDSIQLNVPKFKEMGGAYILSAVEIKNAKSQGLKFEKSFEHPENFWKIYLYSV